MTMTPYQKVKWMVLLQAHEMADEVAPEITAENIDELYDEIDSSDTTVGHSMQDAREEVRCTGTDTHLSTPYDRSSRHYEYNEVASQAPDGTWVGWTYYYGGGKHSEPSAISWMEDVYDVVCAEEAKMVIVQTFTLP